MKTRNFFKLTLIFGGIIILITGVGCEKRKSTEITSPTPTLKQTKEIKNEVMLIIDDGVNNPRVFKQTFTKKTTVYDFLKKITEANNISLSTQSSSFGIMITKIGEKENGKDGNYWVYYVNGEMPSVAVDKYELKNGDKVEFKFQKGM